MDPRFGKKARDKVTGFTGVITGRADYMYGCSQLVLAPAVDKDGKMADGHWFDEGRIEILEEAVKPSSVQASRPGGPQRDAPPAR